MAKLDLRVVVDGFDIVVTQPGSEARAIYFKPRVLTARYFSNPWIQKRGGWEAATDFRMQGTAAGNTCPISMTRWTKELPGYG
jgi:hypothetical protein